MLNRRLLHTIARAVFVSLLASRPTSAGPVRVYRVDDPGFFAGSTYMVAAAINARGDVAGSFLASDGYMHAYRWTESGGREDLGTNGGYASLAFGMNDRGEVVGTYWDRNWGYHPFVARPGEPLTDLASRYPQIEEIEGISNDGRLTGFTWALHAFRTQADGSFQELSSNVSLGAGINENGDVAGVIWRDGAQTEPRHAFRYTDAEGLVDLGTIRGGWSGARAINSSGVVTGFLAPDDGTATHGFRAVPGHPLQDLGTLPGLESWAATDAYALNDAGDVVGLAVATYGYGPFLYTDAAGMIDVRDRLNIGDQQLYALADASGINETGQITAHYARSDGAFGTVRLTPYEHRGPASQPVVDVPVLWPPNHQMVAVTVDPDVSDAFDPEPSCRVSRVIDSEGTLNGSEDDISIDAALRVSLRASRRGGGAARTYTLVVACSDRIGASSESTVVVTVPHDGR